MADVHELLDTWIANVKDEELLAELNTMKEQGDEDAITDAFFQDLAFGTAGLRGTIGAGTNRMNIYTVGRATQGFADYLNATFEHPTVAIARDSRNKGELFVKTTAAILAAKESRAYIQQADIQKAFIKVGIGAEKHSRVISEKEKKITAYHESGHALLFHLLPDVGPVHTVSIIPTGAGAAGYTMPLPEKDEMFNSKGRMLQEIVVDLGGRVAEELVFDDITTGASQDIKQATKMARDMVTRYGMSENIGLICYKDDDDEVFIGRDLAHAHSYSEGIASAIDVEVKRIIDESYEKAKTIIAEHRDVLDRCAALILEKEKITREEFEALFEA